MSTNIVRRWESLVRNYWGLRPWTRHSTVLMIAGLCYIAIGCSIASYTPNTPRWRALVIAREWMSLDAWGFVFILTGCMAILSCRWPVRQRSWGYMVLTGLATAWSGFYAMGILVAGTAFSNLSTSITWGLLAFMWWSISGLVNPPRVGNDGCC